MKRARILIVEDQLGPRKSLEMTLSPFFEIFSVESGSEALSLLEKEQIDVATLDLQLPGISGIDILRQMRRLYGDLEVIIITGYGNLTTATEAMSLGASCYLLKPFDFGEVLTAVNRAVEKKRQVDRLKGFLVEIGAIVGLQTEPGKGIEKLKEDRSLLEKVRKMFDQSGQELENTKRMNHFEFFRILIETIEKKDPYAQGHSSRVNYYSNLIAQRLSLTPQEKEDLQIGTYLHDIGKLGIDTQTLRKKGKYTPEELKIMKKHTEIGVNLVSPLLLSPDVLAIIRHHHEHYFGNGYPDGIQAKGISILARIVAVADAFDAMISDYPYEYKKALSLEEAASELKHCAHVQFDPDVVNAFILTIEEDREKLLLKSSIFSDL